jgi:chondroitin synthase
MKPSLGMSVVIPTYNRIDMLKNTLAGLVVQEGFNRDFEVVLVDNGSDIPIGIHVSEFKRYLDIKIISRKVNIKFLPGTARNIGVLNSKYENILFLDSDCIPSRCLLINHWRAVSPNDKVASIGHRVFIKSDDMKTDLIMTSDFLNHEFEIVCAFR